MIDQDDLVWLADRQPEPPAPDAVTTDRLRMEFAAKRAPRRRTRRLAILAGAAAIAAGVLIVAGQSLPEQAPTAPERPAVVASPLVRLADHVAATRPLPGNATLVERHHRFPDAAGFSGYDLYTDAGPYFYGATIDELHTAMSDPANDQGGIADLVEAAAASANLTPAQARAKLFAARPIPHGQPPAKADLAQRAEKHDGAKDLRPASLRSIRDNYLWIGAMDAITAGAGRADVRAGAMNALSTIQAVHVTEATLGGRRVLAVTNTDFPDGYRETLYLDASTGVLVHFRGGTADQAEVDVAYRIKRVDFDGSAIQPR